MLKSFLGSRVQIVFRENSRSRGRLTGVQQEQFVYHEIIKHNFIFFLLHVYSRPHTGWAVAFPCIVNYK